MKVIARDNYNREYYPERLITVAINETEAHLIAEELNRSGDDFYVVVEDSYKLNLESMWDCNGDEPPSSFYVAQFGLKAFPNNISEAHYDCLINSI